jgi:phosphopantothenoylcysteine decarboxylase / phosphopantothenate---cysteine ligase
MWAHRCTQSNILRLRELGHHMVGPATGALAFGEGAGPGRLADTCAILEHIGRVLGSEPVWRDRRVLVTAGPTREPVDAVRVLTNRSSGRMGFAIAGAAWRRGADVTLVAGPAAVVPPIGPTVVRVETADDMLDAVREYLPAADVLVMAAAVADFRPAAVPGKIRKADAPAALPLQPAPDILRCTRDLRRDGSVAVGFALETGDGLAAARAKLSAKGLDLIVLNRADEEGAGFDVDTNRVVLLDTKGGAEQFPLMSKDDVAETLLDRVAPLLEGRR